MTKSYNKEIAKLKRINYWLIRDRDNVTKLLLEKNKSILNIIYKFNKTKSEGDFDKLKELEKERVYLLREQEALVDLKLRIHRDIYENGKHILNIRQQESSFLKSAHTY